jgi:prepilin-type N-terminal cleavage/methylation domain-containing protein
MISLKKRNQGFTIVELLIVIVVIGILALLVITTYSGIQQKARNNTRQGNLSSVQAQLEIFYQNNGYYPNLKDLNQTADDSWLKDNMKNLNQDALVDPSNKDHSQTLASTPTKSQYSYEVKNSDGTSCESDDTTCAQYTLTAMYEGNVNGKDRATKSNLD